MKDDAISRQGVLKLLSTIPPEEAMTKAMLIQSVKQMDAAQPERKRGKWIYSEDEYGVDGYHCDKCGFFVPWDYVHKFINYIEDYNYCPNCGADLREVDDERPD